MINLSRHQKDVHGMTSSQFLANSCSQDTVFSSIFSCVNNAGDLKMAARYFTLEDNAVAWGGAGGARAPPIIWQTPKNIY